MNNERLVVFVLTCALAGAPARADDVADVVARCRRAAETTRSEPDLTLERRQGAWQIVSLDFFDGGDPTTWDLAPLANLETLSALRSRPEAKGGGRLARLRRLRVLSGDWSLDAADLEAICGLPELEEVSLNYRDASVGDKGLASLRNLKRLRWLSLRGDGLTDAWLEYIKGLTTLEVLGVCGSGITGEGVAELKALPNLHDLNLDWNDRTVARLPELRGLRHLSFNSLGEAELSVLKALPHLEEIETITFKPAPGSADFSALRALKRLKITRLDSDEAVQLHLPDGLEELTAACQEKLNLPSCKGVGHLHRVELNLGTPGRFAHPAQLDWLASLPELRELVLDQAIDEEMKPVGRLTSLRALTLVGNGCLGGITAKGVKEIAALQKLESLKIYIPTDGGMDVVCNLTNLRRLVLDPWSAVSAEGAARISNLKQLRVLEFQSFGDQAESLKALLGREGALSELEELTLRGGLTDGVLIRLATLKKLRRLDLRWCHGFTDAGLAGLVRAMPNLQVVEFTMRNPPPVVSETPAYHESERKAKP